jgi:hypothetical protein
MLQEIDRFDPSRLQSATTEELTKYFYERYLLHLPFVLRDAAEHFHLFRHAGGRHRRTEAGPNVRPARQ